MQELQPKIKKIQERYKTDRDLMRKDPELYRKRKAEQNEQLMALYKDEGVNPASSCLPLVFQAPVFIALFSVLRGFEELRNADFYFVTSAISPDADGTGLGALVSQAGWPGWLLIAAMVVTMFITQRQTMSRVATDGPAAQQQKIMLYVLPGFLAFISRGLPLGVIVYWVTTNIWQGVQQYIIFRDSKPDTSSEPTEKGPKSDSDSNRSTSSSGTDKAPSSDDKPPVQRAKSQTKGSTKGSAKGAAKGPAKDPAKGSPKGATNGRAKGASGTGPKSVSKKSKHLPGSGGAGSSSSHLPGSKT
jgi:YidC/Oxa1 family membrane protein insertase